MEYRYFRSREVGSNSLQLSVDVYDVTAATT